MTKPPPRRLLAVSDLTPSGWPEMAIFLPPPEVVIERMIAGADCRRDCHGARVASRRARHPYLRSPRASRRCLLGLPRDPDDEPHVIAPTWMIWAFVGATVAFDAVVVLLSPWSEFVWFSLGLMHGALGLRVFDWYMR